MNWFYAAKGEAIGPYDEGALLALLGTGEITRDTLVWRDGITWTRLGDRPELVARTGQETKGPSKPAEKPAVAPAPPLLPADIAKRYYTTPMERARPSARITARFIDTLILFGLLSAAFNFFPSLPVPEAIGDFVRPLLRIFAIMLAIIIYVGLNWVIGNSVGKALVGIKAVPADGRRRMMLVEILLRETMIYGRPTRSLATVVDEGRAPSERHLPPTIAGPRVVALSRYTRWRIAAIIALPFIVFAGWLAASTLDLLPGEQARAIGESWTNPQTHITITLPEGWRVQAYPESNAVYFINVVSQVTATFSCDPPVGRLSDYAAATRAGLATTGTGFADFTPVTGTAYLEASGRRNDADLPTTIVIGDTGKSLCRVGYTDVVGKTVRSLNDRAMTSALFKSAGAPAP